MTLRSLQLDNMQQSPPSPVILCRTPVAAAAEKPFLEVGVALKTHSASSLLYIEYAELLVQQMEVLLDEGLLMCLADLASAATGGAAAGATGAGAVDVSGTDQLLLLGADSGQAGVGPAGVSPEESLLPRARWWEPEQLDGDAAAAAASAPTMRLYLAELNLNMLMINLTFVRVPTRAGNGTALSIVTVTLNAVGAVIARLDRTPLRLNGIRLENLLTTADDLVGKLTRHYTAQALSEFYKVVLSMPLLGNPVGAFSALGGGVKDLLVEPAQGLVKGPKEFGQGLATGTVSLVSGAVRGVGMVATSATSAVAGGVALLSFDDRYLRERAYRQSHGACARVFDRRIAARVAACVAVAPLLTRWFCVFVCVTVCLFVRACCVCVSTLVGAERASNAIEGVGMGARQFGRGVVDGVVGVFRNPAEGLRDGGAGGFVAGVGKGIVGLVVKPTVAAVDMVTSVGQGVVATATTGDAAAVERATRARMRESRLHWGPEQTLITVSELSPVVNRLLRPLGFWGGRAAATSGERRDLDPFPGELHLFHMLWEPEPESPAPRVLAVFTSHRIITGTLENNKKRLSDAALVASGGAGGAAAATDSGGYGATASDEAAAGTWQHAFGESDNPTDVSASAFREMCDAIESMRENSRTEVVGAGGHGDGSDASDGRGGKKRAPPALACAAVQARVDQAHERLSKLPPKHAVFGVEKCVAAARAAAPNASMRRLARPSTTCIECAHAHRVVFVSSQCRRELPDLQPAQMMLGFIRAEAGPKIAASNAVGTLQLVNTAIGGKGAGADDLAPLLHLLVARAAGPSVVLAVALAKAALPTLGFEDDMRGQADYALTTLATALVWLAEHDKWREPAEKSPGDDAPA